MSIHDLENSVEETVATLFAVPPNDEYLSTGVLHFQPISAHLFRSINNVGIMCYSSVCPDAWHGRVVRAIAYGSTIGLRVFTSVIAVAEAAGSLAIALLATVAHTISGARFEFLQKHTVKVWAYCIQSVALVWMQIHLLRTDPLFKQYTPAFLSHQILYFGAAAAAQLVFGSWFDSLAGKAAADSDLPLAIRRLLRLVPEGAEMFIDGLLAAFRDDLGLQLEFDHLRIREFLEQRPEHRAALSNMSFNNILDSSYRQRLWAIFRDFVVFIRIGEPDGEDPTVFVLNSHAPKDAEYQQHLKNQVKQAFIDLYTDNTLVSYLTEQKSEAAGRELMDCFDADIYVPLACFAQLKELSIPDVHCPTAFSSERLQGYNGRIQEITEARAQLKSLTAPEYETLTKKILQTRRFIFDDDVSEESRNKVNALFNKLTTLAEHLHQGTLMSESTIDITDMSASSRNLFQKGCQEALEEIARAARQ